MTALLFDRGGKIGDQGRLHWLKALECVKVTISQRLKFFLQQVAKLRALLVGNRQL